MHSLKRLSLTCLAVLTAVLLTAGGAAAQPEPAAESGSPELQLSPEGEITRVEMEVEALTSYDGRYELTETLNIYLIQTGEQWNVDAMRSEEVTASPGAGGDWTKSVSRQASFQSRELAVKLLQSIADLREYQRRSERSREQQRADFEDGADSAGSSTDSIELEMERVLSVTARLFRGKDTPAETLDAGPVEVAIGPFANPSAKLGNRTLAVFSFASIQQDDPETMLARWQEYRAENRRRVSSRSNYSADHSESQQRPDSSGPGEAEEE